MKTFAAAALIAVSTLTMAAGKPEVSNPKKVVVNLSTADLAIDHYIAVMTAGQSAGVVQQILVKKYRHQKIKLIAVRKLCPS